MGEYKLLDDEEDLTQSLMGESTLPAWATAERPSGHWAMSLDWIVSGTILLVASCVSFAVGYLLGRTHMTRPVLSTFNWDPSLQEIRYEWTQINGSLLGKSRFSSPPSAEVDREWDRFTQGAHIADTAVFLGVSDEAIDASQPQHTGVPDTVVRLDESEGGGYLATMEMFHQLHCLNMLRQVTYKDYYESRVPLFRMTEYHAHLDHCIEILRQVIMCDGDSRLIMFHWVRGWQGAVPDFSNWRQCRDPEALLRWAKRHEAPLTRVPRKPSDVVELDERP